MENNKLVVSDRMFRHQTKAALLLLLVTVMVGEGVIFFICSDYKTDRIAHDYAVAGYLVQCGINSETIVSAFTHAPQTIERESGKALLSAAGYDGQIESILLPDIWNLYERYFLITLMAVFLIAGAFFIILLRTENIRNSRIESATEQLKCFMAGNVNVRLSDCGEGSTDRLFTVINMMATSLVAHAEKELKNKEFLKDTISDISHQLKTPLSALVMYNDIISEERKDHETVGKFAEKSSRELRRMETLIQNLLRLARLDADAVILEKRRHSVRDFLQDTTSSFAQRAEQEGKMMQIHCDPSIQMSFDEIWLGEAIGNIIKNALDHTATGQKIDITGTETAVATEISIRDNGAGIHPEDLHHIFKRFYRSRYSSDRQGIGIGLALSKMIVEKHGGTITVQSEKGKGAEFFIVFPKLTDL